MTGLLLNISLAGLSVEVIALSKASNRPSQALQQFPGSGLTAKRAKTAEEVVSGLQRAFASFAIFAVK